MPTEQADGDSQVKAWNEEYESLARDTEKWESALERLDHEELLLAEQRRDLFRRIRDAENRQQNILTDMLERLEQTRGRETSHDKAVCNDSRQT